MTLIVFFGSTGLAKLPLITPVLLVIVSFSLLVSSDELVSVNTNGAGGNNASSSPLLDASGRYVLFQSQASDLAGVPVVGVTNLFFRDTQANATCRLTAGNSTAIPAVTAAAMTPDGHYVAFVGLTQTNSSPYQVCLWDSQAVALVYSNTMPLIEGGVSGGGTNIAVSPDGNRLAYIISSQNYSRYGEQLYVVDRAAQSNWMIATGVPAYRFGLQFSGDSRYLVYAAAPAFQFNQPNQTNDVYRYDFQAQSNLLISQSSSGSIGNGSSDWPAISWDGRFVAYRSAATNLAPGGTNGFPQIYLYDSQSNTTTLLSVGALTSAGGDNRSQAPAFSGDSTTLFFRSWASDLLTNDFSGSGGIFALGVAPPALFCVISFPPGGVPVISWPAVSGTT